MGFRTQIKTKLLETFFSRPIFLSLKEPIVSFTFDDAPKSAFYNGASLLEKYNASGTFYVSMQLAQRNAEMMNKEMICEAYAQGHHIACHTYTHYRLRGGLTEDLYWDATKNRAILSELLDGEPIEHFAYPYGEMTFAGKKQLKASYQTLRSTCPGINSGRTDLTCLRATPLYSSSFNEGKLEKLLEQTLSRKGWLIFYTHGVQDSPNQWGLRPEELAFILKATKDAGCKILNIKEACEQAKRD